MKIRSLLLLVLSAGAIWLVFDRSSLVADYMGALAVWLFERFEDPNFPLLLAAAILAVALATLFGYLVFVVAPQWFSLWRLRRFVNRFRNEQDFAENLDTISKRLEKSTLVGHAWKEFEETLVKPEGIVEVVQNTTRPQTFINYSCAEDHSTALRLMPHIPNYFVGIGLLLTFIGLVAALEFANEAVGGSASEAVDGLQQLLKAATFKFWTSIAGLLASIVLSFSFRIYGLWLDHRFLLFCQAIEDRMSFATPQRIFVDVKNSIEAQLDETKKINTEMAMAIADGVGQQFRDLVPPMLVDAMKPLVEKVEESTRKVSDSATGGFEEMVGKFTRSIEGSAGHHLQEMSTTLQKLTTSLATMQGSVDNSGDEFARRMAEGAERLDATMREVAQSLQDIVGGLKKEVGEASEAFGANLQASLAELTEQSQSMGRQLAEHSRNASASFASEIERSVQVIAETTTESARSSAQLADQIRSSLGESALGVQGGLERLEKSMSSLDDQLARQGTELQATTERSRDVVRALSQAAETVRTSTAPLQAVGNSIMESTQSLENSVGNIGRRVDTAVEAIATTSSSLEDVSRALEMAWQSYQTRFEAVDENLEKAFTQLYQAVGQQQELVQDFVVKLDESFDRALTGLGAGISSINESVEDLVEQLDKAHPVTLGRDT